MKFKCDELGIDMDTLPFDAGGAQLIPIPGTALSELHYKHPWLNVTENGRKFLNAYMVRSIDPDEPSQLKRGPFDWLIRPGLTKAARQSLDFMEMTKIRKIRRGAVSRDQILEHEEMIIKKRAYGTYISAVDNSLYVRDRNYVED